MILHSLARACCLMAALGGGVVLSQYPAFVQQYTQRLGGQVDALAEVVADFDASALEAGLTRSAALDQMAGTTFLDARADDMRGTFARHVILTDQLARLRGASGFETIRLAPQVRDGETLQATWADFKPALQITLPGIVTGAFGFLAGWGGMAAVIALIRGFLRKPYTPKPARVSQRIDPPLRRPDQSDPHPVPRLMGETRP